MRGNYLRVTIYIDGMRYEYILYDQKNNKISHVFIHKISKSKVAQTLYVPARRFCNAKNSSIQMLSHNTQKAKQFSEMPLNHNTNLFCRNRFRNSMYADRPLSSASPMRTRPCRGTLCPEMPQSICRSTTSMSVKSTRKALMASARRSFSFMLSIMRAVVLRGAMGLRA